ncbi:MAG: FAD-dependent oxidoreductase [Planctomycetales bacterium]|nr:FAD-dependent oxidoreductase [Planctomycetales bacterium]
MAIDTPASIAILGAGPIGIEAALYARFLGYDVDLYERGRVCENMLRWGHVRMFSPFSMNRTPLGLAALNAQAVDYHPPADDELLTGREFVEQYLLPLAQSDLLCDCLHEETDVSQIGRVGFLKQEGIGTEERAEAKFSLLLNAGDETERVAEADVVIDCTGTYFNRYSMGGLGAGGTWALGEVAATAHERIEHFLPDILGAERDAFAGRHTLLVGAGYSAATSAVALAQLAAEAPDTQVTWLTRRRRVEGPIPRIPSDRLPQRDALAAQANELAATETNTFRNLVAPHIASMALEDDRLRVTLADEARSTLVVDRILAQIGYMPHWGMCRELQLHLCYATVGPMRLAAALQEKASDDCLDQTASGPQTLFNPEANFYVLGAKSYGRNSQFLIATGHAQIRDLFSIIGDRHDLDLYQSIRL